MWLASLQQLTFGIAFNKAVDGISWPASLQQLTIGDNFKHEIRRLTESLGN